MRGREKEAMEVIKLLIVFAIIVLALKFKLKLFAAMLMAIAASILMWKIPLATCGELLWKATKSWDNITVLLVLYIITFLQRLLERRQQLKAAQMDLNGIFNNRRINATVAPIFIGLLPSAAAAIICGDIVSDACRDDLTTGEKAFVTSYFRHIPESFLPTYTSVIIMSNLCGVGVGSFVAGMVPLVLVMYALGWLFYVRKVPKETGEKPSVNKWKDALNLLKHLWTLIAIIVLILAFNVPVWIAILAITVISWFVYGFKGKELPAIAKSAFEPVLIINSYLILVFKEFLTHTGVITALPSFFAQLPIPSFLIFALIFFFGTIVSGSTAIIALCTTMAFAAIPGSGMPLMVLLMSFTYAAMQISPTHVCLTVVADYYHTTLGGIVKKTIPVIACFCAITVLYYLLLTVLF